MCYVAYVINFLDKSGKRIFTKVGSTKNIKTRLQDTLRYIRKKYPKIKYAEIDTLFNFKTEKDARVCEDLLRAWISEYHKDINTQIGTDTFTINFNCEKFCESLLFQWLKEKVDIFNILYNQCITKKDLQNTFTRSNSEQWMSYAIERNNNIMLVWLCDATVALEADTKIFKYLIYDMYNDYNENSYKTVKM